LAGPDYVISNGVAYQRPNDGGGWHRGQWNVHPESAYANLDSNWAYEAVAAPFAWGCETGNANTTVGVIDMGIHGVSDLLPNIAGASDTFSTALSDFSHGTEVASVIGAVGNNDTGITGMMWRGKLQLRDITLRDSVGGVGPVYTYAVDSFFHAVTAVAESGAQVINLSLKMDFEDTTGHATFVAWFDSMFVAALETAEATPLIVIAAGNNGTAVPPMNDAYWSVFPTIRNVLPSQTLVVAGGGTTMNSLDSESNVGSLIDVAAPYRNVGALSDTGPVLASGTSFSAPMVTGLAGLLFSFDPTLTVSQVRDLIIDGATSGGMTAGSYPLINAYESLKLAARRPGAKLCGNRVWADSGNIIVYRDTATPRDTIVRGTFYSGLVTLFHGGNRIYLGDSMLVNRDGNWEMVETDDSTLSVTGTFWSAWGLSHDGDTSAYYYQTDFEPDPSVAIMMGDTAGGWTRAQMDGFMPVYNGVDHETHCCIGYSSAGNVLIVAIREHYSSPGVSIYSVNIGNGTPTHLWDISGYWPQPQVSEDGRVVSVSYSTDIYGTSCKIEYRLLASPNSPIDSMTVGCGDGSPKGGFSGSRQAMSSRSRPMPLMRRGPR